MTLVIDYSFAHPNPAAIRAAGYVGAVRYLSPDPAKNITPAELAALLAAGLEVALVWEAGATDELGGASMGKTQAAEANQMAAALGWPADRPIYYAADFAAAGGQLDQVAAYLETASDPAAGWRPVGIYGSVATVDLMLAEGRAAFGWQTSAWSGAAVSAHAQLYQRQTPTVPLAQTPPGAWDENVVLRGDWGGWNGVTPAAIAGANAAPPRPIGRLVRPMIAVVPRPQGDGYWTVAQDGGVFAFGQAPPMRDPVPAFTLEPGHLVTDAAATPTGRGLWLVASDGGVFTLGDARYFGSPSQLFLPSTEPITA